METKRFNSTYMMLFDGFDEKLWYIRGIWTLNQRFGRWPGLLNFKMDFCDMGVLLVSVPVDFCPGLSESLKKVIL